MPRQGTGGNGVDTFSNTAMHEGDQLDASATSHPVNSPRYSLSVTKRRYECFKDKKSCMPAANRNKIHLPAPSLKFIPVT